MRFDESRGSNHLVLSALTLLLTAIAVVIPSAVEGFVVVNPPSSPSRVRIGNREFIFDIIEYYI